MNSYFIANFTEKENNLSSLHTCSNTIPLISFLYKDGNVTVQITCSYCNCSNTLTTDDYLELLKSFIGSNENFTCNNTYSRHTGDKYCFDCRKWLFSVDLIEHKSSIALLNHIVLLKEPKVTSHCLIHRKTIMKYLCSDCSELLCLKCLSNHNLDHSLINLNHHKMNIRNSNSIASS